MLIALSSRKRVLQNIPVWGREHMLQRSITEAPQVFEANKYLAINGLIQDPLLLTAHRYALLQAQVGSMAIDDPQVPNTPSSYGDPLMETLLELLCPNVEQMTGLDLYPTYSYFRVYKNNDELKPHLDRPSCEISVTLNLGFKAPEPWPLCFRAGEIATQVDLHPGDAIVYRGCDIVHWRNSFVGEYNAQVFLHYVDQNGPCAEWKYDKRSRLGVLRT